MKQAISICSILFLFTLSAWAQKVEVRGFVYDKSTGQTLPSATVVLVGTSFGAVSNMDGFFNIAAVPKGSYTLKCTSLGYDTFTTPIIVGKEIVNKKIVLNKSVHVMQELVVSADKEQKNTQTNISLTKISSKDIKMLPSIGGVSDLAQYLLIVPGVVTTGDQGGEIYIHGGTPVMNKVLLDGVTIYNPFHSIGLFSVFETEIIKNADVLTDAFNAQYGGRIGAVIDITTRDGNKQDFSGVVGVNPFQSKLVLEGPISRFGDENGGSSFLFTAKTSYLDQTSKALYSYAQDGGLPYSYKDYYGKLNFSTNNGTHFNFFGFYFSDDANYLHIANYNWTQYGGGMNLTLLPTTSKSIINFGINYTNYALSLTQDNNQPRTTGINSFEINLDATYYILHGSLKYGVSIGSYGTNLNFFNTYDQSYNYSDNTTEISGFVVFNKTIGRLVIEPSFRLQDYATPGVISPEPRASAKYILSEKLRLKGACGLYSQNLVSTKSDLDIVDLFTGYLTAPEDQLANIKGQLASNNIQKATHYVLGLEYDPAPHAEFTVQGYYKNFNPIVELNPNKEVPSDPDFLLETGKSYGIDFLYKYNYKRYFIWLTYSLAYATLTNTTQTYYASYDRRNNINILASYVCGKKRDWELDARWNFGSGLPFTLTESFYPSVNFNNGVSTNYLTNNQQLGLFYNSSLNTGRLPAYHRLDISVTKKYTFSKKLKMEVVASIINVYDRKNIFYVDRVTNQIIYQLPIIPSIGVNFTF